MRGSAGMVSVVACSVVAIGGTLTFMAAVLALHIVQPEFQPSTVAVSYYVHGLHGRWLTVGLFGLGLGSVALARLLRLTYHGPRRRLVHWGVRVWGACVLAAAVFPADPMGRWDEPSIAGTVHGVSAMVGFLALPAAALALGRGPRSNGHERGACRRLAFLGYLCAVSLVSFFASLWPTLGVDRPPVLLGLTERLLLGAYVGWLLTSTLRSVAVARQDGVRGWEA